MTSATWFDIQRAALDEPLLHQLCTLVERGDLTQRDAMIIAVLQLIEIKRLQHAHIMELLNTQIRVRPVTTPATTEPDQTTKP